MTIETDDDLPLLTQVLRTGDGRLPKPLMTPTDDSYIDEFGAHHFEDAALTRQIVIGHDAQPQIDDLDAATVHGNASPTGNGAPLDPRQPRRDPFGLSQDLDLSTARVSVPETIDEPEMVAETRLHETSSASPARESEAPNATDLTMLSARLRDSIFIDLASRIDIELDARIAQTLHAEVEGALAQLQGNLRARLTEALRDVVARAVDEEMARLGESISAGKRH